MMVKSDCVLLKQFPHTEIFLFLLSCATREYICFELFSIFVLLNLKMYQLHGRKLIPRMSLIHHCWLDINKDFEIQKRKL